MEKIKLKLISSVNHSDIINFIMKNSGLSNPEANDALSNEMDHIIWDLPDCDGIEIIDEERISKVIISKLNYNGWIKKFTSTQELTDDYYILFTD